LLVFWCSGRRLLAAGLIHVLLVIAVLFLVNPMGGKRI
jgi:hypothetical protein